MSARATDETKTTQMREAIWKAAAEMATMSFSTASKASA